MKDMGQIRKLIKVGNKNIAMYVIISKTQKVEIAIQDIKKT